MTAQSPVPPPPPAANPYARPLQAGGKLRRRPKFWVAVGLVWLATFSCTSVLGLGDEGGSTVDTAAKKEPVPTATTTVTATVTATERAEPEPGPTVTETKKVTVHVTETVHAGGGTAAHPNGGSDTHGLPAGPPPGPDVDCSDLPGPVWVGGSDPHDLDRDGDGIGCDS